MTIEEAIKELEWILHEGFIADENIIGTDRIVEALEMAIKTLEEEDE